MTSIEDSKAFVRGFFAALDRGEAHRIEEWLAPEFVAHIAGAPAPLDREGYRQFALAMREAVPDGLHIWDDVLVADDTVILRGTFGGAHRGDLLGVPATGRPFRFQIMHIDRLSGGKIVEHWAIGDTLGLLRQLGVPLPGW